MRALVVSALILVTPSLAWAVDLEVGEGQVYTTIQDAIDEATAGDAVRVHAGDYTEDLTLAASGAADMPITLTTAGDGDVVIRGAVLIEGSDWDVIGLTFVAPPGGDAFRVRGDRNLIQQIDLSGGDRDGIDGSGTGNEVRESRIHDFDGGDADAHCIVLNPGASGWIIADNELFDCSGDGVQLYAEGAERTIVDTVIRDNDIYWSGAIARMENAIDVKNADGLLVFRNRAFGFYENKTMVFQKGPRGVTVECNVLSDGFTGVEFRAEDGGTIEDVRFDRNLVVRFTDYALKLDGTVGAEVLHNTFVDAASDGLRIEGLGLDGGAVRNNLWVRTGAIDGGDFDADHNGFFEVGTIGIASPTDVTGDPLHDPGFNLGDGSPMIDAGADLGGAFAGSAPDLGWSENGLEGCVVPGGAEGGGSPTGSGAGGGGGSGSGSGGADADGDGSGGGTADGAGGSTGDGPGDAGAGAGLPGSGAGGSSGSGDAAGDDGGCDCRAVSRTGTAGHGWWALAGALALVARRRLGT